MTLHAVHDDEPAIDPSDAVLHFEGEPVAALRAKLTSAGIDLGDDIHRLDDTARLLVTGRVCRIDHVIDNRTGDLVRVETFKIVDAIEVPWNAVSHLLDDEARG